MLMYNLFLHFMKTYCTNVIKRHIFQCFFFSLFLITMNEFLPNILVPLLNAFNPTSSSESLQVLNAELAFFKKRKKKKKWM